MLFRHFIDIWFIVNLSRCGVICRLVTAFYLYGDDLDKQVDMLGQIYQIIVVSMLKNWSHRYSNHYIIKFVCFLPIYYAINLDIISSYIVFSYLYLISIHLLQV